MGKPHGCKPHGRYRSRWEDNIKVYLTEVGWGMNWIILAQDTDRSRGIVNVVMKLWVQKKAGNFLSTSKPVRFSVRSLVHGFSSLHVSAYDKAIVKLSIQKLEILFFFAICDMQIYCKGK